MTAKQPKRENPCTLQALPDGTLCATWPARRIRFLLENGATVDVLTDRDDSDLRGRINELTGQSIIGSATVRIQHDDGQQELWGGEHDG